MRGHARGRLGAASGPPPRGPWVPGRGRLRGLLRRLLSPLRCPPPTRPPPTRPPPSRLPASRVGAPLGGLSAGRALRGRSLRGSLPALRLGSSPSPPPPPRPPLRWKRSRPGLRPRRGRVCALRPPFGGSPCWRQSCWRVRLWLGPRRGPRPFAAPRRPCAPRKICLACLRSCLRLPPPRPSVFRRAPAGRLGAGAPCPRGRHRRARGYRRGAPCRPYARKAPATRGERSRPAAAFFVRPTGAPAGRSGLPRARALCARSGGYRRPRGALPSRPARRALRLPGCAGCGRSQRAPQPPAPRRGGLLMNGLTPLPAG